MEAGNSTKTLATFRQDHPMNKTAETAGKITDESLKSRKSFGLGVLKRKEIPP